MKILMLKKKNAWLIIILAWVLLFSLQNNLFCQMGQEDMEQKTGQAKTGQGGSMPETSSQGTSAQGGQTQENASKNGTAQKSTEATQSLALPTSIEIKRLEGEKPLYSIELRDANISDVFRILAHDYDLNIFVDKKVKGKMTASFTNVNLEEALEAIMETNNLTLQKYGNILKIMPNLVTKTFILKYVEAKKLLESTSSSTGSSSASAGSSSSSMSGSMAISEGSASGNSTSTESESDSTASQTQKTIYDLLSSEGKIFLGKQLNSLMVIDYPLNLTKIDNFLQMVDQRMVTKVFKLRYLSAEDVVGKAQSSTTGASTTSSSAMPATGM
jgi:type II secretory pathway component GspD/PulD (secretin)